MATDKNTIKSWFEKDDRPTQAQFWAWIDSIWHKDEKIPITAIDDIETILNDKADADAFGNHLTDANAHAELFAEPNARLDDLEAKTDTENNWKTITGYSLNPATRVLTMDAGWEGIINGIEYTNVAAQELLPAIPLANSGYSRIDLIVFKTDGTFERISGVESTFTPVAPPKPAYTLEATFLTVGDGVVNVPVIPKPKAPVTSVNGMRGDVVLNAINDLVTGGIYNFLSAEQGKVLKTQIDGINTLLTSNDVNLDTVQELVNAIKTVQTSLSTILVNDLTTGGTTKALTAEMGKTLKGLIDGLTTAVGLKEDSTNKSQDVEADKTSTSKFGSVKAFYDWCVGRFQPKLTAGLNITIDNTNPLAPIISSIGGGNSISQFMNAASFEAYGDSITVGMNSSPTSNSYVNLLTGLYSKTVVNRAVSARGIWEATKQHLTNINTSHTVLAIVMAGFNDVRRGGNSAKTKAKIINGYKSILANHFLNSFLPAGTLISTIVKSGTWIVGYTANAVGGKTALGIYSQVNGSYVEYTFSDTNVVLGLVGSSNAAEVFGTFSVTIDGILQGNYTEANQSDGISDGSNDNNRIGMNLIFSGLEDKTHVVRLTSTSSNYFVVDYFGHLKKPKFCTPILLMEAPKMDATGYATAPNLATNAIIDELNTDINTLVASFPIGYPIVVAKTNDYYNIATGLDASDHIHPNNIGHRQIYAAGYAALNPLLLGGSISPPTVDATTAVKGILKLAGDLSGTSELPTVPALANKLNINANASLAGTGTRMMEASPDGTPICTYTKYQMKVVDTDVIAAITAATYVSGEATIVPASSKIMYEGQAYKTGSYLYRAYSDNVVLRIAIL